MLGVRCSLGLGLALLTGCASTGLESARQTFYAGRPDEAEIKLVESKIPERDQVLYLMERGMARQLAGHYEESSKDFIAASDRLDELERYSLSKGGTSLVVNDTVQDFRGVPYERNLLHAFTAKNHLALGHWNDVGVEARRLVRSLDPIQRGDYPDDAYCRYIAGFGLELTDDSSNAEVLYRQADELAEGVTIDPRTGRLSASTPPETTNAVPTPSGITPAVADPAIPSPPDATHELVCFVLMGRAPGTSGYSDGAMPLPTVGYAEIYRDGQYLGRSYELTDATALASRTAELEATRKALKSATRIALKEGIAQSVEHNSDDAWGALIRLILLGLLERPDDRHWATLPRSLQVARVPCPPDLTGYEVVFKNHSGYITRAAHVAAPLQKHRNTYVSFCRDLEIHAPTPAVETP